MSTEDKLKSSGFSPGIKTNTRSVLCESALHQSTEVGKDLLCDEGQPGGHSGQPICSPAIYQQNAPKVIISSAQRQLQAFPPKTCHRSNLVNVPIVGRYQAIQMSSNLNQSGPAGRGSNLKDTCREKAETAVLNKDLHGNIPNSSSLKEPSLDSPPSSTPSSLPSHPSSPYVPSGQQDCGKLPQKNVPAHSTSRFHSVPHHSVLNPPPQTPFVTEKSSTHEPTDLKIRSSALTYPVLSHRHNLQQSQEKTFGDPWTNQQKDQQTLTSALNKYITRSISAPATPNELKTSNPSPRTSFVKQSPVIPKDPSTCSQISLGNAGSVVTPNITSKTLGSLAPCDSVTRNIKDGALPPTNLSKNSSQHIVAKQPSVSTKDHHTCVQRDQLCAVPSVHPEVERNTLRPTGPVELSSSRCKDASIPQVKINSSHVISEQPVVKQPKVVLKRLEHSRRTSKGGRIRDKHDSAERELIHAHLKLRTSIDALTKNDKDKSVRIPGHIPKVMSPVHSFTKRLSMSKHFSSSSSSSNSSPSKSSATRESHSHSRKHLFGRSKSFSYCSSWKTPNKKQALHSPSSDPSWKLKLNPSFRVKVSSWQLHGENSSRVLNYEDRRKRPSSSSKSLHLSSSPTSDYDSLKDSEQKGGKGRNVSSSNSTIPKQIASSLSSKVLLSLESNSLGNHSETLSDSEAHVRKSGSTHFRHKNKSVKPFVVDKKPKQSPNQSVSQHSIPSEGKLKNCSSNSQKNLFCTSSENQPSFMQLLEIASKNTNQTGNHDWEFSRKRRYSDGQINKCQPTDPRHFLRPFPEGLSSIKIPRLERLREDLGEMSSSENSKTEKGSDIQGSSNIASPDKVKVGELSDKRMEVGETPTTLLVPKGVCQGEGNSVSVKEVPDQSSVKSNSVQEKSEDGKLGDDRHMFCEDVAQEDIPEHNPEDISEHDAEDNQEHGPEDVEMTSQTNPSMEVKADTEPGDERKPSIQRNLFGMMPKKEGRIDEKVEDNAAKEDVTENKITGSDVQRLFSELQKSNEECKRSNPSSPGRASRTSSPSRSDKKLLNIVHLKKVKNILTGIALKRQTNVDSDASTKDGSSSSSPSPGPSGDERQLETPPSGNQDKKEREGAFNDGDIFRTENSDSESSEDDDSFLQLKPSALIDETNALMDAPMPVTPSKVSSSQVAYSPVLPQSTRIQQQGFVESLEVGYTLDKILHMKRDQDKKDGDIIAIRDKLMDDVSRGGIAKLATETDEVEEDIDIDSETVDYANYLAKFPRKSESIPDVPPGEEIFNPEKMCKLFTPTQCLCVNKFLPNRENQTSMESLLLSATPEEVEELITSNCLEMCETVSDEMMRWMFLLMSIHPSAQENHHLYQTQWMHLNKAPLISDELRFPWIPSLKDVISVLLNYGGDLAGIVSVSDCELDFNEEMLRDEFSQVQVEASSERRDVCFKEEEGVFVMVLKNHLCQVIKILTQAIFTHMALKDCSGYRTEELQCLLIIMMRIALDKTVIGLPVAVDITMAIAAILEGFEDSVWYQEVERICVLFPLITSHHHNMVYLLWSCMPLHIERGRYLCRRLSYAGLQNLVLPEKSTERLSSSLDQTVPCIKISSLIPILQCCKPSKATDYYQLNSIIQLLDYTIGNEVLDNYEKRDLDQIYRKLREMVGDIRDSALSLSRSQVKSLLLRTATKLSFMTQSMLSNQRSIFGFLRSDTPVGMDEDEEEGNPEHHIRSQDDAASLPSDDGDDAGNVEMEEFSDEEAENEDGRAKEPDIPADLESMDTSEGKEDHLEPGITTSEEVESTSEETQIKPGVEAGVEKIFQTSESNEEVEGKPGSNGIAGVGGASGGGKENELEYEIKASGEVHKNNGEEKVDGKSETLAGVGAGKQYESERLEALPKIAMDKGESGTSEGTEDLKQKPEISNDVGEMKTVEGKKLELNSEDTAGVEIKEALVGKRAETEQGVKVNQSETVTRKEIQPKPAETPSCLEARESLSSQKLQLDSKMSNEKALGMKVLQNKTGIQILVEAGEVSKGKGQEGESCSGNENTPCRGITEGGEELKKTIPLGPDGGEGFTPDQAAGESTRTKKTVWVPVKVECDTSPVKGSFEEIVKRPVSAYGNLPLSAARGVVVKVENEEIDIIDLTSPDRRDASNGSFLEAIEVESDENDVICLD